MTSVVQSLLLLSVAASSGALAADLKEPSPADEIVVEGKRVDAREIDRFVGALTPAPIGGQIGRFELEVCPAAIGLEPQQNQAIAARIRTVAAAVGAKVGKANCRTNLLVVASWQPQALIKAWRKKYPEYFRHLDQPVHLADPDGPAIAWHVEGRRTADGIDADIVFNPQCGCRYYRSATTTASRLKSVTRPHFLMGVLVLDKQRLGGLTATQVADYATMRLLARTRSDRLAASAAPTIMSVIEAEPGTMVPVTLTSWDFSFLKALYGSSENRFANQQRGEMQRMMRKELQGSRTQP